MRDDLNANGAAAGIGYDRKQRSTRCDLRTGLNARVDYLEPKAKGRVSQTAGSEKKKNNHNNTNKTGSRLHICGHTSDSAAEH